MQPSSPEPDTHRASGPSQGWAYLACVISLAAIASQWWENRKLREELKTRAPVPVVQKVAPPEEKGAGDALAQYREDRRKMVAYHEAQNAWIDQMNQLLEDAVNKAESATKAINQDAEKARGMRNAQSIVSVNMAGVAAGVRWQGADRDGIVKDVINGRAASEGPFKDKTFKVPIAWEDLASAMPYMALGRAGSGELTYDRAGKQPPGAGLVIREDPPSGQEVPKIPPMPKMPPL